MIFSEASESKYHMTKKLEELLNLPENKKLEKEITKHLNELPEHSDNLFRNIDELDKISAALPIVKGLGDQSDKELDDLAERALSSYQDLMDLGMNVELRYASRIMEVASTMLKNAIDAKAHKIDKKIKMVQLQLQKEKLDNKAGIKEPLEGEGVIVSDRNSLLEKLKNMK
jgi:hypothetical protein